jgi:hypothetical protein
MHGTCQATAGLRANWMASARDTQQKTTQLVNGLLLWGVAAAAQGERPAGQSRHRARLLTQHLLRRHHEEAGLWPSEAALAASMVRQ